MFRGSGFLPRLIDIAVADGWHRQMDCCDQSTVASSHDRSAVVVARHSSFVPFSLEETLWALAEHAAAATNPIVRRT